MNTRQMSSASFVVWLLLALAVAASQLPVEALIKVKSPEALENLFNFDSVEGRKIKKLLDPIDLFLEDILPVWFNQAPNNQNGTRQEYRDYALRDTTNDDASHLSAHQLIARSGYRYEVFDAIAEDGYITQLTHLINPLANPLKLRQPPVLMEHGGSIDPTAYLLASSIQHFPEPWPRREDDGPMRSWNRSLAFQLANNGFDVWLAETRGSNDHNKRHINAPTLVQSKANSTTMDQVREIMKSLNYWSFTQDDIIAYELKSHMDTVLKLTGSTKLHLMTFSLSTPTSLAFLGAKPDYAAKVQGYVSMAPIVSGQGTSKFINLLLKTVCPLAPDEVGTLLLTDVVFTQPFRELLILVSLNKDIRYILFKSVSTLLMGASPKYATLLDLNLIGHLFRQLSFREFKQMCQQMASNKLQKFDYGPIKNQLMYKQPTPPQYNIDDLHIKDWIIVSGSNDALSTPKVIKHLLSLVQPQPVAHIVAPNFNHLDLFAGWENDIYVNEPIMHYFERLSHTPGEIYNQARSLDINSILPQALHPEKFIGQAQNITKQFLLPNPLESKEFVETLAKSLAKLVESLATQLVPKLPILSAIKKPKGKADDGEKGTDLEDTNNKDKGQDDEGEKPLGALEKALSNFKAPGLEKLLPGKNEHLQSLLDPKKFSGQFGESFSKLKPAAGGEKSGDGGDNLKITPMSMNIFDNLKSLTSGMKLGKPPGSSYKESISIDGPKITSGPLANVKSFTNDMKPTLKDGDSEEPKSLLTPVKSLTSVLQKPVEGATLANPVEAIKKLASSEPLKVLTGALGDTSKGDKSEAAPTGLIGIGSTLGGSLSKLVRGNLERISLGDD